MKLRVWAAAAAIVCLVQPVAAGGYQQVDWADLKPQIFGDSELLPGDGVVTLQAPTRAEDDARVPVNVTARLTGGAQIVSVTLIIDENPAPVSAVFRFDRPRYEVDLGVTMRFNGPSPLRAVIETTDGRLIMTERLVKTSGRGACSAPPVGDPDEAIAGIGEMRAIASDVPEGMSAPRKVSLEMTHPQHTGLQMNQVTLHYILARYIQDVAVWAGDERLFTLEGSISLAENPGVTFEIGDPEIQEIRVRMEDIDGTVVDKTLLLGAHG